VSAAFAIQRRLPSFRRPRLLALRGFLGGLGVTGYFLSIEHLPVGPATLLKQHLARLRHRAGAWFLHEHLRPRRVLWLLLAMAARRWSPSTPPRSSGGGAQVGVAAGLASAVVAGGALTSMRALRRTPTRSPCCSRSA